MKITTVPQLGNLGNQIHSYDRTNKNNHFESNQNINNNVPRNILKRGIKKYPFKPDDELNSKQLVFKNPKYEATDGNCDRSCKNKVVSSKRNQRENSELNLIHRDVDDFYDSELIRKLSDNNGKLPQSIKLVIPADKDPIVLYNETDGALKNSHLIKRDTKAEKGKVYDYNYYDDQVQEESPLNSREYKVNKKNYTSEKMIIHTLKSPNSSVNHGVQGITKTISLSPFEASEISGSISAAEENSSIQSKLKQNVEKQEDGGLSIKSAIVRVKETFNNKIKSTVKRKGTGPSPESGGSQVCHPSGGLPKNPGMAPLVNKEKDPEYQMLLRGEISENVIKEIIRRVHGNPQMVVELGMGDLDLDGLRNMFKQARTKNKKDCCLKLRGEFKCFLNWLLSTKPARIKRSESSPDRARLLTCDLFPEFMATGDHWKPSPQYEKLVRKVEEYKEENNL